MNLASVIDSHPDGAPALVTESGEVTTFGDLRQAAAAFRTRLVAGGVQPGDRVAILSANDPAFVSAYLAILGVGAVAVPLNPGSPRAELTKELAQVGVKAVVAGPGGVDAAAGLGRDESGDLGVVDTSEATEREATDGIEREASEAANAPPSVIDRDAGDLAVLLFTSGTSGAPRPAMLTHGNLLANLDQVQRHPGRALTSDDVCFGVLPLFHIFGLNVLLGGALSAGASVLLVDRFDPTTALDLIERYHVTILLGSPTMYAALAAVGANAQDDRARAQLATLRLSFSGAAPLSGEIADECEQRLGLVIRQGYGLTEAGPVVTSSVIAELPRRGSIGVPLPGVEVRLIDDESEDALAGDPGEIWVRGPNVFPGYWEDDVATKAVLTPDGWLKTGDIAVAGDDGELYIVDRAKDLIIVSGFNVFPAEVEEVLCEHPGVAEVAVVGERDPYRGETVHAYVVAAAGEPTPTPDELINFCAERLARYKCPTDVSFLTSLPHGLGGKLLRRDLRSAPADAPGPG